MKPQASSTNQKARATRRISAIFFDLDSTLVHAQVEVPAPTKPEPPVRYGPYYVWLRPCAHELIALAKKTKIPLFLCTSSQRIYATGISRLLDLGFAEQQILGCEHMLAGETDLAPDAILIDDLPPADQIATFKRLVLGTTPDRYFQVPPFTATSFQPEPNLISRFQRFLQHMGKVPNHAMHPRS